VGRKSTKKLDLLAEQLRRKGIPVMETGHEVWLAGLGALSIARKKGEKVGGKGSKIFDRLVAEGQKLEKKVGKTARSDAHEVAERLSGAADKAKQKAKKLADKARVQAKKVAGKARAQAKKIASKTSGQTEQSADKARAQAKKTVSKASGQAKKGATKTIPKRAGPAILHLLPKDDEWTVRLEGSEQDLSLHATKYSAVKAARVIARAHAPSHLVVHRADGTAQESFSYE